MIAKMKFVSISGHASAMNHVIDNYLSRYDIQLEHVDTYGLLKPFTTLNPYSLTLKKADMLSTITGPTPFLYMPLSVEDAVNLVETAYKFHEQRNDELRTLEAKIATINEYVNNLNIFASIDINLHELESFIFIRYQFGKLPLTHFLQYEKFLADDDKSFFTVTKRCKDFIYGIYFTPSKYSETIDSVFASLKFEPIPIASTCLDESIPGTPKHLIKYWTNNQQRIEEDINILTNNVLEEAVGSINRLAVACRKVKNVYRVFDIKKFANISQREGVFTFSGWMAEEDAARLESEIVCDNLTILAYDNPQEQAPPVKLKNPPFIRQFEFFTGLYGLPSNKEIDPTPFLAITYTILFGLMFGDVGHGLVLAIAGLVVRAKWKNPLGPILIIAGASAFCFGFLYGSIFGFEDALPALWRRPAADIPGTLMFAASLGAGLIVLSILLNMYNSYKKRDISNLLFGANGAAGLVFYGAVLMVLLRIFAFNLPPTRFVVILVVAPLIFVTFKHSLERLMAGKSPFPKGNVGQFIFSTTIELFETLLTYATNTISFVRVGAFAISHAGMMHVVLQLSQGATGRNWLVLILGNVLVLVIEGLLVGIQVLRLNFYEMFSRFYTGGGQIFVSNKLERD